jgi:hypothetical protein
MSEAVVLGRGQLYRPEATPRAYTADRGPIRLYEDIIQGPWVSDGDVYILLQYGFFQRRKGADQ